MAQKGYIKNSLTKDLGAPEMANMFQGIFGASGIMSLYENLACVKVDNNTVRMSSGAYNLSGHLLGIAKGTTEDLTIDSGTSGQNRNDLVVAEFVRNGGGLGVDTLHFTVVKGTSTSGAAADPALTQQDINAAGVTRQEALYRVKVTGTEIAAVEKVAGSVSNLNLVEQNLMQNGKKYQFVAGALRNVGGTWSLINDATHRPENIASISQTAEDIRIDYNFTASKIISLVAVPDETYVKNGLSFGASVGNSFSLIRPTINKRVGGYILYDGTSWVISNTKGVSNVAWITDKLIITHDNVLQAVPDIYYADATHRDGNHVVQIGSLGLTTTEIKFYNFSGNLITTPNANMKFYFNRCSYGDVAPNLLSQLGSNVWVFGIFEIA